MSAFFAWQKQCSSVERWGAGSEITSIGVDLLGHNSSSPEASSQPLHTPRGFYYLVQHSFKYLRAPPHHHHHHFLWNTISQPNRSSWGNFLSYLAAFLSRPRPTVSSRPYLSGCICLPAWSSHVSQPQREPFSELLSKLWVSPMKAC